ncbi:TetR/AcrR family transcriptional regulator [Nonomuraea glycinis]|uniref:TetR/AcrR family transcriptional regulator n=1 Tax=Nonomuraea glycinis TaxID=2047744 RepID=UPI0033BA9E99
MASSDREHVLQVAYKLFAALGYDATSTSQIAEAAGVQPAVIEEFFGGRRELYIAVMRHAYDLERASLHAVLDQLREAESLDVAAALHLLVDNQLDFVAVHPDAYALRTHRWLSDAMDVAEVETRYLQPLYQSILDLFQPAVAAGQLTGDTDLQYVLYMCTWCIHGFALGGVPHDEGVPKTYTDEREWRRFRLRLHQMVHRALLLPGDYSPTEPY